jgi:hypothetical protein
MLMTRNYGETASDKVGELLCALICAIAILSDACNGLAQLD